MSEQHNAARMLATRLAGLQYKFLSGQLSPAELAERLRALAGWVEKGAQVKKSSKPEGESEQLSKQAEQVYQHWLRTTQRTPQRWKFTKERKTKVVARLRDGYSVRDICEAVDYVAESDFHRGDNEQGQRYDDLVTICRNGTKLETYRNSLGVEEMPGKFRQSGGENDPLAKLRDNARQALKEGKVDDYNAIQEQLRGAG